jgi:hypothetical protein
MKQIAAQKPKIPAPKIYHDYRKMLDECHKELDAVLIATPDHHHAPAAIRSIRAGKATFCQKPLTHNIAECRALAQAAVEHNVPTQMGNQRHCEETIRRVCEYIWAGAIGNVTETHTILNRTFGGHGGRPPSKPVPAGLHWDEWLGPAPYRDYHEGLHPFFWRSWRQFGTGVIGDMACHHLDFPFWALRIGLAKTFAVECLSQTPGSEEMYPQHNVLRWSVPARGNLPPLSVYTYDCVELKPEVMKDAERKYKRHFQEDTLFVGDKGLMGADGYLLPTERHKAYPPPPKSIPRVQGGPIPDLFRAVREGGKPCSNFPEAAAPLTTFALTGHLAMFAGVGQKVEWDVAKMECTNRPELNRFVTREYRKGWEV